MGRNAKIDDELERYVPHVYEDAEGKPIPIGTMRVTRVYDELEYAYNAMEDVEVDGVKKRQHKYRVVSEQGGTRSTKTVTTMAWCIIEQLLKKRCTIIITRKTMPTLKKSVFKDFRDVMNQLNLYDPNRLNKSEMEYQFKNGSVVTFMAVDNSEKLKGVRADIVWMNEATEYTDNDRAQFAFRTRFMILDYNPNFSEHHWLNEVNALKTTHHFITTYKDNPFLSAEQVAEIESYKERNYQRWIQYGTGQRCLSEGRVFQDIKIVGEYDWPLETYLGIDFGGGAKPSAVVKVAISDTEIAVQELFYKTKSYPEDWARALDEEPSLVAIGDSASPLNLELTRKHMKNGSRLKAVNKRGHLGKQVRLQAVWAMSGYRIVIVSDRKHPSDNVQKEFAEYCYKTDANENVTNIPIEENDHAIDATRYVYMSKAPRRRRKGVTIR